MPRPRLRPGIAACTCAWRVSPSVQLPPRKSSKAPLSTSAAPIETTVDCLHPVFGFFSRSLPAASLSTRSDEDVQSIDPISGIRRTSSTITASTGTWSRGFGTSAAARCICGSARIPCLRCRSVSTSAVPRTIPYEEEEGPGGQLDHTQEASIIGSTSVPTSIAQDAGPAAWQTDTKSTSNYSSTSGEAHVEYVWSAETLISVLPPTQRMAALPRTQ
jgi:hypothetical protein